MSKKKPSRQIRTIEDAIVAMNTDVEKKLDKYVTHERKGLAERTESVRHRFNQLPESFTSQLPHIASDGTLTTPVTFRFIARSHDLEHGSTYGVAGSFRTEDERNFLNYPIGEVTASHVMVLWPTKRYERGGTLDEFEGHFAKGYDLIVCIDHQGYPYWAPANKLKIVDWGPQPGDPVLGVDCERCWPQTGPDGAEIDIPAVAWFKDEDDVVSRALCQGCIDWFGQESIADEKRRLERETKAAKKAEKEAAVPSLFDA